MKKLKLILTCITTLLVLNACTSAHKPNTRYLSGNWQIRTLNGEPTPDASARIRFDPKTHQYFAYFGCNQISGTYHDSNHTLRLSQPAGINKLCANIEDERTGTGTLGFVDSWRIVNDNIGMRLQLLDKNNYVRVEARLVQETENKNK
ncbi:MAG: META domain-containing protein [Snodgrassella sp.]|uniref:META domain-containing protein n=1 Tax=Snodgrassella sp. TaxID=2815304 RepID=UPI0025886884|nr:META domain-containing protein [Snodgrassella sp.]MCO6508483.1 META domain-containing protein [Snodgrassella sp.]